MGKHTGKKEQVLLKLNGELKNKFEALRTHYGAAANTELVRILINEKYRDICKEN